MNVVFGRMVINVEFNEDVLNEMIEDFKEYTLNRAFEIEIRNPRYEYSVPYGTLGYYSASRADLFVGGVKRGKIFANDDTKGNKLRYCFDENNVLQKRDVLTPCYIRKVIFRYAQNVRNGYEYFVSDENGYFRINGMIKDIYDEKNRLVNHLRLDVGPIENFDEIELMIMQIETSEYNKMGVMTGWTNQYKVFK